MNSEDITAQFNSATDYVLSHSDSIKEDTLLEMYGLYKQVTRGPCDTPKPSWFDYTAKIKWKAWRDCRDLGKTTAMYRYVSCLDAAVPDWRQSSNDAVNGIAVSSMTITDEDLPEDDKTIFDWVKEGSLDKLKSKNFDANCKDDNELTLLHWAADRGDLDIVRYLVEVKKANLNCLDDEGQTPLHYAAACGYPSIVEYLIKAGADIRIVDKNQTTAKDAAESDEIANLFPK